MKDGIVRAARSWVAVATAVATGGAVAFLALSLAGAVPGLQSDEKGGGTYDASRLHASNRDRLAICVDAVNLGLTSEASTEVEAQQAVQSVLSQLAASYPAWDAKGLSEPEPVVDTGCPISPSVYDPNAGPRVDDALFEVLGRRVEHASYYRTLIFVLPDEDIRRFAGTSRYRVTTEEYQCMGDVCPEVTTGIYFGVSELADQSLIRDNLAAAIGLQ